MVMKRQRPPPAPVPAPTPAPTTRETRLHGMKAIAEYAGYSHVTILRFIREEEFPARRIGAEWVSDVVKIDAWFNARIEGD